MPELKDPALDEKRVNVLCCEERGHWRVYLDPEGAPTSLHECFDDYWEAYPVVLDFDDLDAHLAARGVTIVKRQVLRGFELEAKGPAARVLARWLTTALASGIRPNSTSSG